MARGGLSSTGTTPEAVPARSRGWRQYLQVVVEHQITKEKFTSSWFCRRPGPAHPGAL